MTCRVTYDHNGPAASRRCRRLSKGDNLVGGALEGTGQVSPVKKRMWCGTCFQTCLKHPISPIATKPLKRFSVLLRTQPAASHKFIRRYLKPSQISMFDGDTLVKLAKYPSKVLNPTFDSCFLIVQEISWLSQLSHMLISHKYQLGHPSASSPHCFHTGHAWT